MPGLLFEEKTCRRCKTNYNDESNHDTACNWHHGSLELFERNDYWDDHDEEIHGVIDTDDFRDEHPQGFNWTCCERTGEKGGCRRGRHVPREG
ncbi:hypothetical protein DM02DRAFT_675014 [Periconia macrospinosa]|uniref:C2H2-type domain-containing protein n=1 Tax=Periconia macrospinosa TaxID=97972 RepID=A0A2V1DDG9_9PLEO|nr:hypothetical protein DM02DRAFT_675014 [Periconia macrospinosa]